MKHRKTGRGGVKKPWQWNHTHGGREKRKTFFLCKTTPIFPGLCAQNHLGFATEVSGGDGFCLDWVLWGRAAEWEGWPWVKVLYLHWKKDCCSARKRHTEEIEHATTGETHIPMCHDKQRGCVSIRSFFFSTTTIRCVASVCRAKQQVQVASKEGASRKEIFSNTKQGEAKSIRKQKKEQKRRRNQLIQRQIKSKIQTSHLFTLSDREQTKTGWAGK